MNNLAIKGGEAIVPQKYQKFIHPLFSEAVTRKLSEPDFLSNIVSFESPEVHELQNKFKSKFNVKYALSMNSGASALFAMFYGLGLVAGDEVIVPNYTFFATATPLHLLGCKVVLADAADNGNIDPEDIERKITNRTKAIVITHMWGIPCDMDKIMAISNKYNIPVVEDASHAHGATYHGQMVGSFSKASAWSMGSKKIVTGGQGGMLGTNDEEVYQKATLLGHANNKVIKDITNKNLIPYSITGTGTNLRIHPFSAYMLLEQLDNLEQQVKERQETAAYLTQEIKNIEGITTPRVPENATLSGYAFNMLYDTSCFSVPREKIVEALIAEGASEADIPRSTCPLTEFPLFRQGTIDFTKTLADINTKDQYPGSYKFHESIIKFPTWYGEDRMKYAENYLNALKKVLENISELS